MRCLDFHELLDRPRGFNFCSWITSHVCNHGLLQQRVLATVFRQIMVANMSICRLSILKQIMTTKFKHEPSRLLVIMISLNDQFHLIVVVNISFNHLLVLPYPLSSISKVITQAHT